MQSAKLFLLNKGSHTPSVQVLIAKPSDCTYTPPQTQTHFKADKKEKVKPQVETVPFLCVSLCLSILYNILLFTSGTIENPQVPSFFQRGLWYHMTSHSVSFPKNRYWLERRTSKLWLTLNKLETEDFTVPRRAMSTKEADEPSSFASIRTHKRSCL